MKILKSSVIVILCLSIIFSLSACGRKAAGGYYVDANGSEIIDSADTGEETVSDSTESTSSKDKDNNKENKKENNSSTSSKTTTTASKNSGGNRTEQNIWKIRRDVEPSAKKSVVKNLNLKGKTIRMLVWNSNYTEQDQKIIKAYEKEYNCKVEVTSANYESYFSVISTQLSSGKPFDIIKMHRAHFPHTAIAKMIQPLEDYISKEDLSTTSKKPGINWDWTYQNATWNNHVYYTVSSRPCALPVMVYNKVLFQKYGLEDPMDLWKKGKWTLKTIESYAKQVKAADKDMYFYDSTVSSRLSNHSATENADYFSIAKDGTVKWLGANTAQYKVTAESQRLLKLSNLDEMSARLDTMTNGQCMLHAMELDQLVVQTSTLKGSAAFGKNINNVGIVPMPYKDNGTYYSTGVSGYAASRGCDPAPAIAMAIFYSKQNEGWDTNAIPAIQKNRELLYSLYDKMEVVHNYTFLTADGKEASDILYQRGVDISKGGDIMKLLESYSPKIKSLLEYSLSKQ